MTMSATPHSKSSRTNHQLDPEVAAMAETMKRNNVPRSHERGVEESRRALESIVRGPGPDMRTVETTSFTGIHGEVPVRVYIPFTAPETGAPALVWFHGGGMIMGSLDSFDLLAREIATATSAVILNVDYRLAPEHRYPVANDEAYEALAWAHSEADRFGIDPLRIGVGGDSAGGSLAAATALRSRNEHGPHIAQQVLIYPGLERRQDRPSMREFGDSPFLCTADIDWMKSLYLGEDSSRDDEYGVPALASDLTDLPPAVVVSGYADPLRDAVEDYGHRLQDAGVPTAIIRYPGVAHGFFMQTQSVKRARIAMSEVGGLVAARFAGTR